MICLQAKPDMVKSGVVDNDTGESKDSEVRHCWGSVGVGRRTAMRLLCVLVHMRRCQTQLHALSICPCRLLHFAGAAPAGS